MSIALALRKAALNAFKAFSGIPVSLSYYSKGNSLISTTSGIESATEYLYSIPMAIIVEYEDRTIDGTLVEVGDKKILIPGILITFTPKNDDYMIIVSTSVRLHVINFKKDAANAVYTFQVRK